ncbi:serine hydrolase [Kineosporia sp. NBRC 101677]|uniref:serine hydrolase domain-containing protein n=1 Tax=Kineosporia sp. NBRC 101677 TaxID=3032197 RepID=UPI0024A3521B|nr:serine hydrolase domain-containing protein [Kineosporia sp. NBRC 101677]GLY19991.1 serine hydrolase [Kineosporia sp. NBRC 101677]
MTAVEEALSAATLQRRVDKTRLDQGVPGLSLGVSYPSGGTLVHYSGTADVATGRPAGPATQFRLGSITKTFTAALTLLLVERGKLDLDQPVERYLPGTGVGRPLVRQLLAHTSGLQREAPHPMWSSMMGPNAGELMSILAQAEFVDEPGARWHYSNLGYALLGQVITAVTGQSCEELINQELLEPLSLNDTTWHPTTHAATGYRLAPYQDSFHPEPQMDQGAIGVGGQLWGTTADLLTWGNALLGNAPNAIPESVVEAMHRPQTMVDRNGWTQGWGLGLILNRRHERILSGHTGAMPGFTASMSLDRSKQTVVTAFANVTRGIRLADLTLEVLDEVTSVSKTVASEARIDESVLAACPVELAGALGRWWCEAEETIFTWHDGALHAHLADTPTTSLTRFSRIRSDEFRASEGRLRGERLHVRRDAEENVIGLEWATYPYSRSPR